MASGIDPLSPVLGRLPPGACDLPPPRRCHQAVGCRRAVGRWSVGWPLVGGWLVGVGPGRLTVIVICVSPPLGPHATVRVWVPGRGERDRRGEECAIGVRSARAIVGPILAVTVSPGFAPEPLTMMVCPGTTVTSLANAEQPA